MSEAAPIENPRAAISLEPNRFTRKLAKKIPSNPPTAYNMVKIPNSRSLNPSSSCTSGPRLTQVENKNALAKNRVAEAVDQTTMDGFDN
jgi:hypothetical protein